MSVFNIIPDQEIIDSSKSERMMMRTIRFMVGDVTLTADLLLPHNAPEHSTPLISKIHRQRQLLWNFKCKGFDGRAHLIYIDDQPVIVYVGSKSQAIERVETIGSMIGGEKPRIKATVQLKYAAAEYLAVDDVMLSDVESKVSAQLDAQQAERAKADLAARRAEKQRLAEERKAAREEKRQAIMGRQELKLRAPTGKPLYGLPVVDDEWQCLCDGSWIVRVSSYEDGHVGDLIEHAVVSKKHGRVELKSVTTDLKFAQRAQAPVAKAPEPIGTLLLEIENDVHEVPEYAPADVQQLKGQVILGPFACRDKGKLIVGRVVRNGGTTRMILVQAKQFA